MSKAQEDLTPLDILTLLRKVPDEDCELLNLDKHARPEDLMLTQFPVPPVCIRPSVAMGSSGSNEDDLTMKICTLACLFASRLCIHSPAVAALSR